jgi:hypothetical protein
VSIIIRMPGMPPTWSDTAAATTPPDRTTRRISATALSASGNEVKHKERQGAIERAALEGQGAGIRLPDSYSRIGAASDHFCDKDRRIVDRGDLAKVDRPSEREGQASGAAADVENPFRRRQPP